MANSTTAWAVHGPVGGPDWSFDATVTSAASSCVTLLVARRKRQHRFVRCACGRLEIGRPEPVGEDGAHVDTGWWRLRDHG